MSVEVDREEFVGYRRGVKRKVLFLLSGPDVPNPFSTEKLMFQPVHYLYRYLIPSYTVLETSENVPFLRFSEYLL